LAGLIPFLSKRHYSKTLSGNMTISLTLSDRQTTMKGIEPSYRQGNALKNFVRQPSVSAEYSHSASDSSEKNCPNMGKEGVLKLGAIGLERRHPRGFAGNISAATKASLTPNSRSMNLARRVLSGAGTLARKLLWYRVEVMRFRL
jgi:hypothetical protein